MRTKTKLFFRTIVLAILVAGVIGCKSNGGPWYDVRSYAFYNPLRLEDHARSEAPASESDIAKPHMDPRVDIRQPEGGYYYEQRKEAAPALAHNGGNTNGIEPVPYSSFQKTGLHNDQPPNNTNLQPAFGMPASPAPTYNGINNSTSQPITQSGYTQPASYNHGNYPSANYSTQEVKNDAAGFPNTYATPNTSATAGFPAVTKYQADNNYPQPNYPQPNYAQPDNGINTAVASPFANPTGQQYPGTPTSYGAGQPANLQPGTGTYNGGGLPATSNGSIYTTPSPIYK
ncbi:MAG: hypothetical protein LBP59_07075 [Planctomycetaceae bacterium]|jgi:hypothetical protein|nr:hypothetical protein [Planctomycetaceae bacterium]